MSEDTNSGSNNLSLSEASIKEIIILLSDIDVKINALNESSAKDFLTLNSNLKENYKLAEKISVNAKKLFDILAGKDRNYLLKKLDTFHTGLKFQIEGFSSSVIKGSKVIETLQGLFNSMIIPIKNINQNIMTLNFLLANLKLNLTYQQEDIIIEKADVLMKEIKSIKEVYDLFDANMTRLKALAVSIQSFFGQLKEQQNITLDTILEQVQSSVTILSAKYQEASIQMPLLTKKTEDYFENISKIITNLQFHDIIRQKMEHVQNTHKEIINELNSFDFKDTKALLAEHTSQFLQIRDIAGVQVAQLIHTNQEYQDAIEKITINFLEIGDDMKAVSEMCNDFSGHHPSQGSSHFREIEANLEKSVQLINKFGADGELFSNKVKVIVGSVSDLRKELEKILSQFDIVKTGMAEVFDILKPKEKKLPEIYKLGKQLSEISKAIREDFDLMSKQFKIAEDETLLLETLVENSFESKFKTNLQKFSESIFSVVKILNSDNAQVEEILEINGDLGGQLAVDIQSSIEKVKYYDFFEQVIEEIILELNNIYLTIKSDSSAKPEDGAYDLESLKNRYTMKSQRTIHGRVLHDMHEEEIAAEEEDDDIEFF
ncbi:MAG: hypothetical protein P1P88_19780 [Bacteroidales bacterium]|nr:hypothetical protein [Bacteroidales bacterium]